VTVELDGVEFRLFQEDDRDWVLGPKVDSLRATLTPRRAATMTVDQMVAGARSDLDKYHFRAKGPDELVLACLNGDRIGLVWIAMEQLHQEDGNAWLLEVYVDPRYRRRGLGGNLIRRAEDLAIHQGAEEIMAKCWRQEPQGLGPVWI
jgi:GNAT superfamily N-acetyltransferase